MILVEFPRSLLFTLLLEWICGEDFVQFDSALCNVGSRPTFLSLISETDHIMFMRLQNDYFPVVYLSWLQLRNIRIGGEVTFHSKALQFFETLKQTDGTSFLPIVQIKSLVVTNCSELNGLSIVLCECKLLETLTLIAMKYANINMFSKCINLTTVNFSNSDCLNTQFTKVFCDNHKLVTSFDASFCEQFDSNCIGMVCEAWKLKALILAKAVFTFISNVAELRNSMRHVSLHQNCLLHLCLSGHLFDEDELESRALFLMVLQNNPSLTVLDISFCGSLVDADLLLSVSSRCSQLTSLDVSVSRFPEGLWRPLPHADIATIYNNMPKLLILHMMGTILSVLTVTELVSTLPALRTLSVGNNNTANDRDDVCVCLVLASVFSSVETLWLLSGMRISGVRCLMNERLTVDAAKLMYRNCASYQESSLSSMLPLTCKDIFSLLPQSHQIKSLTLCGSRVQFPQFVKKCGANLTSLDVTFTADQSLLLQLSITCGMLRKLTLTACPQVDDDIFIRLCKKIPMMSYLVLRSMASLNNRSIKEGVAQFLRHLTHFELSGLTNVTPSPVKSALSANPRLLHVVIRCEKIKSPKSSKKTTFFDEVVQLLPNLNYLLVE